jgi:hypothetical protein
MEKWPLFIHPLRDTVDLIPNTDCVTFRKLGIAAMTVRNVIEPLGVPVVFKDMKGFTLERKSMNVSNVGKPSVLATGLRDTW